jgi:hypothetical protein
VTRLADAAGVVSFADTPHAAGRRWARTPIDVAIVAASVQLSKDGHVIRVHPIRLSQAPARRRNHPAGRASRRRRQASSSGRRQLLAG